jgi:2-octaprenyl-6-methoxyphenol hydroxylase
MLFDRLKRSKFVKFIGNLNVKKNHYKLVINSDPTHPIIKKYFYRKIEKNYNSLPIQPQFFMKKLKIILHIKILQRMDL